MSRNGTRLRALESRLRSTGVISCEAVPDPRVRVSLPWMIRKVAAEKAYRRHLHVNGRGQTSWDASRRCRIDVATGRPSDEVTAERIRADILDLDARWRECGDFHVALRAWADEGVDWNAPLYPACQWKERGYARFRRQLGHERSIHNGAPRRDDADWAHDIEGEEVDLEELAILGWEHGLDLEDWRFTHELA